MFQTIRIGDFKDYIKLVASVNINQLNDFSQNLLQEAISYGQDEIAEDLIKRGINVNNQDNRGLTPLHYCGLYKKPKIALLIIENGGGINIVDEHGNTPLWTAIYNAKGEYDVVNVLAKSNANFRSINKYGKSPLDFATQISDDYIIKLASI